MGLFVSAHIANDITSLSSMIIGFKFPGINKPLSPICKYFLEYISTFSVGCIINSPMITPVFNFIGAPTMAVMLYVLQISISGFNLVS